MEIKDLLLRNTNISSTFSREDLEKWNEEYFFRFQCLDWEVGEVSFGMHFDSPEEAIEEGSTVLKKKKSA